jgi:quercetin dioxygenase-like cupin family protein
LSIKAIEEIAQMELYNLKELNTKEPLPGYRVNFIHSANMTFAHWVIEQNAILPSHSHPHEQVTNVIEGSFQLNIGDEEIVLNPGMVIIIPTNATHSGKALTSCKIIDTFYPIREDYR